MNTPLIVPARPAVIRTKRCETCGCAAANANDPTGRGLECHRNPPQVVMAPIQTPQGVQAIPACAFPPVPPEAFCVDGWRPKVEMMS